MMVDSKTNILGLNIECITFLGALNQTVSPLKTVCVLH